MSGRTLFILVVFLLFYPKSLLGSSVSKSHVNMESLMLKVSKVKKPKKSSSQFTHWTYDITQFTAIHCWNTYKNTPLPKVLRGSPVSHGVWKLPHKKKIKKLCLSLAAKGIHPVCTQGIFWNDRVKLDLKIPSYYLQVDKKHPLKVGGVITCYLNSDKIDAQKYSESLIAEWMDKPSLKSFSDVGERESRTVKITAPDASNFKGVVPYSQIMRALYVKE